MAWSWTSLAIIVAHSIMCSPTFSAVCLSLLTTLPQSTTTLENTTPQETSTQTSPAITGCLYEEAPVTTLPLGESYFDGCVYCYCSYDGDGFCDDLCVTLPCPDEACPLPHCVDAELMPGGCCPECPNGPNCYLPSGEVIPAGLIRIYDRMKCECSSSSSDQATCTAPLDINQGCWTSGGKWLNLPPGEFGIIDCRYCRCNSWNDGMGFCEEFMECPIPPCVDAQTQPGECCRVCLNGPNCVLPSGEVLSEGDTRQVNNMTCRCPQTDYYSGTSLVAECFPFNSS